MSEVATIALTTSTRINAPAPTLPTSRGFMLAMEDIAAMEDMPVQLDWKLMDDTGDPQRSRELAEAIVADPSFVAAVGPMGSTEAFANAPVFAEAGLLHVSPCASHPDLCRRGWNTFHRLVSNEEVQGGALARLANSLLGADRIAVVHDRDAFGTTLSGNVASAFQDLGGTIVAWAPFDQGREDFTDIADAVAAADPDVVVFAVHGHEGTLASTAIRSAGVRVPFLSTDGLKTSFFLGGGDDRGEAYHTHSGADIRRLPAAADFRRRYAERWPEDSTYSAEAYDAAMAVAHAVRRAGRADRAAVLDAFRSTPVHEGISGEIRFDDDGERLDAPISFYRVTIDEDGQRCMTYQGVATDVV